MNASQLAQQIKFELQNLRWGFGENQVLFGPRNVFVFAGSIADDQVPPAFPFALVRIEGGVPDEDEPSLILQTFSVAIAAEVTGDPMGEHAIIGGSHSGPGVTSGSGVAELSSVVRGAIQDLTGIDGAGMLVSGIGTAAPAPIDRHRHIALEEFNVQAYCTATEHFTAPDLLRVSGSNLVWNLTRCVSRYDYEGVTFGYVTGSTPVASPDLLTEVLVDGKQTTSFANPGGTGRTYQVFADYSPRGVNGRQAYSQAEPGSYITV